MFSRFFFDYETKDWIKNFKFVRELGLTFIDISNNIRKKRRIERDTQKRDRTLESIEQQYTTKVEPMYKKYVEPTKQYSDIIINQGKFEYNEINDFSESNLRGSLDNEQNIMSKKEDSNQVENILSQDYQLSRAVNFHPG